MELIEEMTEQKYYVKLKKMPIQQMYYNENRKAVFFDDAGKNFGFASAEIWKIFTKSDLAEIMDGFIYKKFIYQFDVYIAEDLELMGFKVVDDEYDEEKQQFKNEWEWINPLIELVPVESEGE